MEKKWYVLYVESGKEDEIRKRLLSQGFEAVVPIENRMIRSGGKWIRKPYVVFPGYVFVHVTYNWATYYIMSKISGVIRLLGGGKEPEPLTEEEARLIVFDAELFREPPIIRFTDDGFEILPERFRKLKVKKIDRHARRITFCIKIAGRVTEFKLSFSVEETPPALRATSPKGEAVKS